MSKKTAKSVRAPRSAASKATAPKLPEGVRSVAAATAAVPTTERTATVAPSEKKSFPLTARIVVVATANPKRPGTKAAAKWPLYATAASGKKGGATVADVIAAFVAAKFPRRRALSALRWDSAHGFIKIEG